MIALDLKALEVTRAMIESRAFHFNNTDDVSSGVGGFRFQTNTSSTFKNELQFAAAKSVRTSIVTLASFDVVAAVLTMLLILWDGYKAAKQRDANFNLRASWFKVICPADAFPFILSIGVIIQGIIFAYVQSRGFTSLSILDCMEISQAMLPAMFITLFIQVVLGGEMAVRAVLPRPFPTRSRWVLPGCLVLIFILLMITFAVTQVSRPPNFCFASLYWLIHRWKSGVLVVSCVCLFFLVVETVIITIRLRGNGSYGEAERLTAFRIVFYLATAIISLSCLLPFFVQSVVMDLVTQSYDLVKYGMVASVVGNLTGIITGGCYVFLRTKKAPGPESDDWSKANKQAFFNQETDSRVQSVNSNDKWLSQIQQPVSPLQYGASIANTAKNGSIQPTPTSLYGAPDIRPFATGAPQMEAPFSRASVTKTETPNIHVRQSSNVSFEDQSSASLRLLLPAATYDPSAMGPLAPPPRIRTPDAMSHRRGTSLESTATVQIGLRLSNVNDIPALNQSYAAEQEQTYTLNCPTVQSFREPRSASPPAHGMRASRAGFSNDRASTMSVTIAQPQNSGAGEVEEIRLSPTVYNPKKPVARKSTASETSRYEDDAIPDPLFARKDNRWI